VLENHLLLFSAEPVEAVDTRCDVVHLPSSLWVKMRADPGTLAAEQATVGTDSFDQQAQRLLSVEDGVEVEFTHSLGETMLLAQRASLEPAELVRHGPAAVADYDLELREVVQHIGRAQIVHRNRLLIDEVQRVGNAVRARASRMD